MTRKSVQSKVPNFDALDWKSERKSSTQGHNFDGHVVPS